ncbi:amidohydrolase family protein [Micromonospora sp. NPDC049047]|uniref:amidohydrolase family protein n=1 Tax=Micromonospora sp. NPDC049047 TaxID=3155645 RepID=UPI0033FAE94D
MIIDAHHHLWTADYQWLTALDLFGPQRLMAGSDWPVCELVATYDEAWTALHACLGELSPDERTAVLADTAIRTYALEVGS